MSKTINISLPEELVNKIDRLAKGEYASRSDFIRETLVRRIKGQTLVDEWGDTVGEWDDGIDLRSKNGSGVPAHKLLKLIEEVQSDERSNQEVSSET